MAVFLSACDATKRVPDDGYLLTENTIYENGEKVSDSRLYNFLYQKPNSRLPLLNIPLRLYIYNLARPNIDSILNQQRVASAGKVTFWEKLLSEKQVEASRKFKKNFNEAIKTTGEAPAIVTEEITQKSANRLTAYYVNNGYFNAAVDYKIVRDSNQRAVVNYLVEKNKPYLLDSLIPIIPSAVADSIYYVHKDKSLLRPGNRYTTATINAETERITSLFRNNGMYHFESNAISIIGDTVNTNNKANLDYIISNRKETISDSVYDRPYKVHKVSKVNIITDYNYSNRDQIFKDSLITDGYNLYAYDKIHYRPKALTDIIPLEPGSIYKDTDRVQTLSRLSLLGTFKYPSIQYNEDPQDSTRTDLVASIRLTPLEKYKLRADFDVSTSNIQDFGIAGFGSLLIRNIFRGAETLELSGRGSLGASDDASNPDDSFFNISEIGADARLTFPRIFFPINTKKIIPAEWQPNTRVNVGIGIQKNIGLDKQTVTGGLKYNWSPSWKRSFNVNLIDAQYVRNLNPNNYFNIYRNTYNDLNRFAINNQANVDPSFFTTTADGGLRLSIPNGAEAFINAVDNGATTGFTNTQVNDIQAIAERQERLTEDNLIVALSVSHTFDNRENIFDETFSRFRTKIEFAGNVLALAGNLTNNEDTGSTGRRIFGVTYSQYVKTELDYARHWDLGDNNIIAIRAFGGIAIPYGNSNSIPFIRSFFGGGSNDNRAWRPYDLGPGSSGSPNEFNEANMKLAFNAEYRFDLIGPLEGALFTDVGNIWNVFDNVEDEASRFTGLSSLEELAIGTGFGLRWDFDFFALRFDIGFKTYNPALDNGDKWFRDYNFSNAVYNVGINYPF
ncbi:outer membrane protein assembly factor [Dokdonia sp. Hel_I_53]|uniref:translocation and assembly module lipoprotein TamL n=1 Tax=Dokdonia sp. Hel_I_53 TaxID=1566287 RepID=UPI0021BDA53E|nr:outer membrane protein assembly factor [Dokdonia sp. Hel_I_53]